MEMPDSAKGIRFEPLLTLYKNGYIDKICRLYSPGERAFKNGGTVSCYMCERSAHCKQMIFERLAAYEMSGLSPKVVMEYKKFEDEVISNGLTFKDILAHYYKAMEERK